MALASDDLPDWGEADDVLHAALPHLESAYEHSAPPNNLHVKRVEMLNTQKEEKSDTQQEADASTASYEPSSVKSGTLSTHLARAHRRISQMLCHA